MLFRKPEMTGKKKFLCGIAAMMTIRPFPHGRKGPVLISLKVINL
jgi:hypothetical protein